MSSNIQEFFRNIFFLIITGLFLMISDQVKKSFVWSGMSSNIQEFSEIYFSWLLLAYSWWFLTKLKRVFCGQQLSAIYSNVSEIFFFLIIAGYSWQLFASSSASQCLIKRKSWVAVSQRAIGFRFLMQRYYILIWRMLMFAHVCSYRAGEMKGLLSGDNWKGDSDGNWMG